jgi:hypothetical protein
MRMKQIWGGAQTPARVKAGLNLRDSFDSETELVILLSEESADFEVDDKVAAMWAQWVQVVSTIQRLGGNPCLLKTLVADDVLDLDTKIFGLEAKVGNPPGSQEFKDCGTVWDGLEMLGGLVKDLTKEVEKDKRASETLVSALETSRNLKNGLETDMTTGVKEVEASMQILADAVKMLSQEQEKLTAALLGLHQGGKMSGGANHPQVGQLLARVKLLEARLPALPGGRLGDESFRSRVDVLAFVEEHVPSNCYYLFHDVVTLMEALTTSHVEHKDVLEEWYRSTKVGVNEASARHMASFRLILPTVFGRSSWWEWCEGSRLHFWRWPEDYFKTARDDVQPWLSLPLPKWLVPQRVERDPHLRSAMRNKPDKIRRLGYIEPGEVRSLTSFFSVLKGDKDIRMVYDGTKSGLNDAMWAPWFALPTIETHLRFVSEESFMGDLDIGNMFHNFVLHEDIQKLAGIDLTPFYPEELKDGRRVIWERWTRCAMGLKSSPYNNVQGFLIAEEWIRGGPWVASEGISVGFPSTKPPGQH